MLKKVEKHKKFSSEPGNVKTFSQIQKNLSEW